MSQRPPQPTSVLVRTVHFPASHHYSVAGWAEQENVVAFGENRHPHEHTFAVTVEVQGMPDPDTGFVVDLGHLDGLLESVVGPLRDQSLNEAIPEVLRGEMLPSTEALARWCWPRIADGLPPGVALLRVRVSEGPDLAGEVRAGA